MDKALGTNRVESLQSQSWRRLTNKTALTLTAQRIIHSSKYQTLHSTGRLASKFARFVSDWKHLEHYGCSCLCHPRAADTDSTRTSSLERSIYLTITQNLIGSTSDRLKWRQSSETKVTLFRTNTEHTHCLEVMLLSRYCAIFGCCNTTEYCNHCWAAICIIFSSNNFTDHTYWTI